jgi:hypothetical protein
VGVSTAVLQSEPTQAEVQALRAKAKQIASDLRNLSTLTCRAVALWRRRVHSLRAALVGEGLIKGSA